jgi:cysteine desulfurase/selenocysteine lyase
MKVMAQVPAAPTTRFDVHAVRRDFPALDQRVHGKPLVYLDNAATAQKPRAVVEAEQRYYLQDCANVHRGVHTLAERATRSYEEARIKVGRFLNVDPLECVFTRGTTEAMNLVAQSFARPRLREGDEVLITHLEHHSNIVPWQLVCAQTGATLRVAPVDDKGDVLLEELFALLGPRTKVLSIGHVSNALGTVNPLDMIIAQARAQGVPVVVDGAQAIPHGGVDVKALGCDFYAFSGHKAFGPTGVGVLWGKKAHLDAMPPYQGGGDMIRSVSFTTGTSWNAVPMKFEAGTPNIAGVIGLGAAIDYLAALDRPGLVAHEQALLARATAALEELPGLRIIGQARQKVSVLSFVLDGAHPHDMATIMDHEGVAIRAGHHCAQPLMERFGVPATARASFAFYNTLEEVDALVAGLVKVKELFG